jgi:predicted metallo-beta-lactamase superfamily hydrolase
MFQRFVKRLGGKCEIADSRSFDFGEPVPHGEENSEMGWVLMTLVKCGDETFIHSSDVQGPIAKRTLDLIRKEEPDVLILGGPPTYLKGVRVSEQPIQSGIMNAAVLAATIPIVILEHHILRSESWSADAKPVFESAYKTGNKVVTAAEYLGQTATILESRRLKLYEEEEPSAEFLKWAELSREKRQLINPPI